MAFSATYDTATASVRLNGSSLGSATWATIEYRPTGSGFWTVARGGWQIPVSGGTFLELRHHDFPVQDDGTHALQYRVTTSTGATETATVGVTVADQTWLKWPGFPFLNRQITVTDRSDIRRDTRGSLLAVTSQARPLAVQEYMAARKFEIELRADTWAEWVQLDTALGLGAVMYLLADSEALGLPTTHFVATNVTASPGPARKSSRRYIRVEAEEVQAPGYLYTGAETPWTAVVNSYATWSEVLAAHATWSSLLTLPADANDIIVGG